MNAEVLFWIIIVTVFITWLESIIVFNGYNRKKIAVIEKRYTTAQLDFRSKPLSFKLPYPFEVVIMEIDFDLKSLSGHFLLEDKPYHFNCEYKVIDARTAFFYMKDLKPYISEFISSFLENPKNQSVNHEEVIQKLYEKLKYSLKTHGFDLTNFEIKDYIS